MKPTYIQSAAALSPQNTFDGSIFEPLAEYTGDCMVATDPDFGKYIPAARLRRMSRFLKMGLTTATLAIQRAGFIPEAICVGTGNGCCSHLEKFMRATTEQGEELLSPIPFMASGHNNLAAQIAMNHQIKGYNMSFLNGSASFENALSDAHLLLCEGQYHNVIVGGADEITDLTKNVFRHIGDFLFPLTEKEISNKAFYSEDNKSTLLGEGAAFFCLTSQPSDQTIAQLVGVHSRNGQARSAQSDKEWLNSILASHHLSAADIDLVISGENGANDAFNSQNYSAVYPLFGQADVAVYKHLCGEYYSASSFALFCACQIFQYGKIPSHLLLTHLKKGNAEYQAIDKKPRNILIYHAYNESGIQSVMILSCGS